MLMWEHHQLHRILVCPKLPGQGSLNKQNSLEFPSYYERGIFQRCRWCLVSAEVKKWGEEMEDYHDYLELKKNEVMEKNGT